MTKKHYLILVSVTLLLVTLMIGCGGPAQAKTGDTVSVHYTGRLVDGTIFDTSVGSEPYEFTLGQGQTISGFEQAVVGMEVGESKTVTIPADEAYGLWQEDLIFEVGIGKLSPDIKPEAGMLLQGSQGVVTIIKVSETSITIDANHPLAGKDLTFDIELVEIGLSKSDTVESGLTAIPLAQALSSGLPTIAEFGRGICIPCKQMKPILEDLAIEYEGRLNVVIVEIDDHTDQAREHNIILIPTQLFFDSSGQEITRHVGFWPREEIIEQLKELGIE